MNTPTEPSAPTPPPAEPDRGSILVGFFVGWGVLIASCIVVGGAMAGFGAIMGWNPVFGILTQLIGFLPIASLIGLIIWYAQRGKTRSALGVAATFGSLVALAILLVAACFGMLATSGNWH
jgi:hypothetical protein